MSKGSIVGRLCLALALAIGLSGIGVADELPVSAFAKLALVKYPEVSPDGKHIATLLRNDEGRYDVAVCNFGSRKFNIVASLKNRKWFRIDWIRWANNERLLVSASFPGEAGGNHYRIHRLYSVGLDGDSIQLTRPAFKDRYDRYRQESYVISTLNNDPQHILLQISDSRSRFPGVYKVDIYTSDFEKVVTSDHRIYSWVANNSGDVVLGWGLPEDDHDHRTDVVWYRASNDKPWQKLKSIRYTKDEYFSPVAALVEGDGTHIFVLSDHNLGRVALYNYDLKTGQFGEPLFSVKGHDLSGVILRNEHVVGVAWNEDYAHEHYFSKRDAKLHALIKNTFKGAKTSIASMDYAANRILIEAVQDNIAPRYYTLDLTNNQAKHWLDEYPQLNNVKLASVTPYQYRARDGMQLNGYLTLPVNSDEKKPPLVVLPHGGPWARDYRYFDWLVQYLASRGYAVLQMNFRGSTGFGTAYETAGYKQWGQAMQADVMDAVAWAKKNAPVDTNRSCMLGWSYGGYVAMMASEQTPTAFKCFVSIAGVSDLPERLKDGWGWETRNSESDVVGDISSDKDMKMLRRVSPVYHVDQVQHPVLLIHGTDDTRVNYQQSAAYYNKAWRRKKPVRYIEIPHGTHYLNFEPNRIKAFEAIDAFLKENLE